MKIYRIAQADEYYHITPTYNIDSILENGLTPSVPNDMSDTNGVYMFRSLDDAHDAIVNWLGDRYDEDVDLSILSIDPAGVSDINSVVGYEVMSRDTILPKFIKVVETGL